ncbi:MULTISPECIES: metal ABC transporter permease [unclassified Mumia]|uniref:metal ABC transporter permease n=1 Tax=unclassified Mumia TaxID=2621872 RepID=UPI002616CEA6|nr:MULTISPECIES: metal ABC transporter permease [unclassified Mumia]MDD9347979.1 metal ABC transporter permease [Mumia sp.]
MAGVIDILSYDFMRQALLAAVITGLTAPAIGMYLVQRRLALLGDGIGHIALTGVAAGLLTNTQPLLTAVVVSIFGAVAIELLRTYGRTSGDVALALLFYGGLAGGVMLTNLAGGSAAALNSYLFGSITTIGAGDLVIVGILGAVVLLLGIGLSPQLFAVCQDEEHARVSGVPVQAYALLIAVLAAVTVTVSMRTVGLLLVSALMVVPVAAAQQVSRSFRGTFLLAMVIGTFAAVAGLLGSYEINTQPGPTIVIVGLAVFLAVAVVGHLARSWRRRGRPAHDLAEEAA